jgi:hypothetical protein
VLHLLVKAFDPTRPPIPLLHMDTTFRAERRMAWEMLADGVYAKAQAWRISNFTGGAP